MFSWPLPVLTNVPDEPTTWPFSAVTPVGIWMVAVSVRVSARLVAVLALSMMSVALPICQLAAAALAAPKLLGRPASARALTVTVPLFRMVRPV